MTDFLRDDVVILEEAFNLSASQELRDIHAKALEDDRDLNIGNQALKAALLRAYAAGQVAGDAAQFRQWWNDFEFVQGATWNFIPPVVAPHGYGFRPHPTKPGYLKLQPLHGKALDVIGIMGEKPVVGFDGDLTTGRYPRTCHVRDEDVANRADQWEALLNGIRGVDYGGDDKTAMAHTVIDPDGSRRILCVDTFDTYVHPQDRRAHASDCPLHKEPLMAAVNCTCGAQDKPVADDVHAAAIQDWDDFPKVGLVEDKDALRARIVAIMGWKD